MKATEHYPSGNQPVRVLIVDDSSFMRASIRHILRADESIEIAGLAADGQEAVSKVMDLKPDVMLLDMLMPGMDGMEVIEYIMSEMPIPILVLSGLRDPAVIIKAFDYGVVDYIQKPSGPISYDIDLIGKSIIKKIKMAARANVHKITAHHLKYDWSTSRPSPEEKIVVIGASTGGPKAISEVLPMLPRQIPACIFVVQHIGQEFIPSLAEHLRWICDLEVSIAEQDEVVSPGRIIIAPGGCHSMVVTDREYKRIRLRKRYSLSTAVPSIDYAMESAARVYGCGSIGVLLTGIGRDGVKGMKSIKEAGGSTIAEHESTCLIFGMPRAAIETGCVDEVIARPYIARTILEKLQGGRGKG